MNLYPFVSVIKTHVTCSGFTLRNRFIPIRLAFKPISLKRIRFFPLIYMIKLKMCSRGESWPINGIKKIFLSTSIWCCSTCRLLWVQWFRASTALTGSYGLYHTPFACFVAPFFAIHKTISSPNFINGVGAVSHKVWLMFIESLFWEACWKIPS